MKKVATPSRTQSVTPRKLLQNTIANDPEPKEKQKPIKSEKKEGGCGRRYGRGHVVSEDVAMLTGVTESPCGPCYPIVNGG